MGNSSVGVNGDPVESIIIIIIVIVVAVGGIVREHGIQS